MRLQRYLSFERALLNNQRSTLLDPLACDAFKWINERKRMFKNPDGAETLIIRELFKDPKMRESIHTKNILSNRPSADIYIAAKAKQLDATVVTAEEYKPHSAQLPNICEKLGVTYITFDDFMEQVTQ